MKKITIIIAIIISMNSIAQDLNNHWQLGVSDINFTTNPPIAYTNGVNNQYGSSSISDDNGNLLFYTNGSIIWNKNHQVMENGGYINGYYSYDTNQQPAIIVPNLGISGQYFVFTSIVEHLLCLSCNEINLYKVSTVDFNDTSFPLGKVINSQSIGQNSGYYGPLTVTKNASNDGYFVIINVSPTTGNGGYLYSYKIDSTGLNLNPIDTFINNDIGYYSYSGEGEFRRNSKAIIKFSPDNLKLGGLVHTDFFHSGPNTSSSSSRFFTLDFNNTTGTFSNYSLIQDSNSNSTGMNTMRDFEFSDTSNTVFFLSDKIYVKDLTNLSIAPRVLSEFGNNTNIPNGFKNIQRDKYNNILVSSTLTTNNQNKFIHRIDSQNSYSNSSVLLNSISLNNNTIDYLPQQIPSLTDSCPNNLSISLNVSTGTDNHQASSTINATNIISSGVTAIYHAGDEVLLKDGFNAKSGSIFRAYIEGCSNVFVARQIDNTNIKDYDEEIAKVEILEYRLKIAPNPNNGIFNLSLENFNEGKIEIVDLYGFTIYKSKFKNQNEVEINIQERQKGIYILKIYSNNQVYTDKIIKK